ncbi:MAG: alpha/beta hydrolase [Synechococcaceae bacterium WBA_2_066]|nr:alpha/beta hydrolase [Synechococcaceae bacterium WB8_1A_041]NDC07184.1 alpha/beta hydrolase [Synechococcaceae bacterium WB9_2_069]NDE38463.1 alpha/beta hydrolase [Synechococcaceae bacterium WBA_2_066]NDG02375.1 alpha/beta hydrolase [Synechococcaceae bacterium WBB_34_004]
MAINLLRLLPAICLGLYSSAVQAQQDVRIVEDVNYMKVVNSSNAKEVDRRRLDLYIPSKSKCFPTLLSVHGGGLMKGDKSEDAKKGKLFASSGIAAAVINYRLTPEVSHPAHVEDVAAAFAWTKKNISSYGGDPSLVYIIGHSAGAYLITLLALNGAYLAKHDLKLNAISGAIPVSAFHDIDLVAPNRPIYIWGEDPKFWESASTTPKFWGRTSFPKMPWLAILADGDEEWRRDQNYRFVANLKNVGFVDVSLMDIKNRDHNSIWDKISDGDEVSSLIINFVSKHASSVGGGGCKLKKNNI